MKINGLEFNICLNGNLSGRKDYAKKQATIHRKNGYYARVMKRTFVSGRIKDKNGKTTRKFRKTRWDVYLRPKISEPITTNPTP